MNLELGRDSDFNTHSDWQRTIKLVEAELPGLAESTDQVQGSLRRSVSSCGQKGVRERDSARRKVGWVVEWTSRQREAGRVEWVSGRGHVKRAQDEGQVGR